MFYRQSLKILKEVKKAKSILVNVHRKPDLDSIGSATVMMMILKKIGKKVDIVCPTEVADNFKFLKYADKIKTIDFRKIDNSKYDLFIILDSGSYDIVTGSKEIHLPDIEAIVIDHHKTNNFKEVKIKLFEEKASATCEIIYKLISDWGVEIDKTIATALFSGIAGDTVFFRYTENTKETFKIVASLIEKGADKDLIMEKMFNSYDFDSVRLIGELLSNMKKEKNFVWSSMNYETFKKFGLPRGIRELTADLFFQSVKGVKFGLLMLEEEKGKIFISFRSIKDTDVSIIAKRFGGGGHKHAAGATITGEFHKTINMVVDKLLS